MTNMDTALHGSASSGVGSAVVRAFSAFALRIAEKLQERRALAELSALDDRHLADIGLSRDVLNKWRRTGKNPL